MKNILFNIMWFVVIAGAGFLAYVSMGQLDYEFVYERPSTLAVVGDERPQVVDPVVVPVKIENLEEDNQNENQIESPEVSTQEVGASSSSLADKNPDVISRLENLVADKIQMKAGSYGTRVATVQVFLNLFDGKNITPDNDYGPGTQSRVKTFQESIGIDADGLAGPKTYENMISWMKSN